MDALDGAAEGFGCVGGVGGAVVGGLATDGMIEDEDSSGAGTGGGRGEISRQIVTKEKTVV